MFDVLVRRDRWITIAALSAVTLLSWLWLFRAPMSHAHEASRTPAPAMSPALDAAPMKEAKPPHAETSEEGEEEPEFP